MNSYWEIANFPAKLDYDSRNPKVNIGYFREKN
ncbi:hypothetical protein QE357_001117 [Siphonobacter sp. BAB-5404]|nr:hypothetical protein [Siphonobacter sp. SORGH_AS_1065]MDR6194065.1 hypothetical protein [Siphonobacter sp. SORGH_AS_0500]